MKKGFTLIELMVTIAIMGVIFTIGYSTFSDYAKQQALISLSRSLIDDLKSAQQSSVSGSKPADSPTFTCGSFRGYRFVRASSTRYRIDALCSGGFQTAKTVNLPAGFTISSVLSSTLVDFTPVNFKPLAQGTNIPINDSVIVTLIQTATGNSRSVTIGSSGNVEE